MNDYDKIAKAIDYIRSNVNKQPSLEDIAAHVHLSPYHFQRLFSRWAGVSPKRFLQVLTLQAIKTLLKKEHSLALIEVADTVGLSSGSRLFDHFVTLEAVTPSQYTQAGQGLHIVYGYYDSPFGNAFIATTTRGICQLLFVQHETHTELSNTLQHQWPHASVEQDDGQIAALGNRLFASTPAAAPLPLLVRGTNFQIKVWQALLSIKQGQLSSYGDIAKIIGKPKAARAVGTAIGANPIALIIPCHRVIQQSGALGGYRWGETRKQAILVKEMAPYY